MSNQRGDANVAAHFPQTNVVVFAAARQQCTIRGEHNAMNYLRMTPQSCKAGTASHIPQSDGVINASAGKNCSRWRKSKPPNIPEVSSKSGKRFRTGTFPEQNLSVLIPGSKLHFSCHLTCSSIWRSEQEPFRSATIKERQNRKSTEQIELYLRQYFLFPPRIFLSANSNKGGFQRMIPQLLILFCVILAIQSPNPQLQAHPRFLISFSRFNHLLLFVGASSQFSFDKVCHFQIQHGETW
jgi:hypothetical protein